MMVIEWIKKNKLASLLLVILLIMLWRNWFGGISGMKLSAPRKAQQLWESESAGLGAPLAEKYILPPANNYPPSPEIKDRLVIQESWVSLLTKNVKETVDKILDYAKSSGGYMVNSSTNNADESPSATVVIRVPESKLRPTLDFLRGIAIKVVSENLTGEDVTDHYVDIEARLSTLNKTKLKFEEILDKAVKVEDILTVQREIINLQSQIDSLKGQQQYLEKSAQMAKITIYLSTDEIALPYAPTETWRPNIIFKLAIRSLIGNLRSLGSVLIWMLVYAVIWVPLLLLVFFIRKKIKK
ncbi:DUF4349 domain-containing protein [Candidatus Gottesmanbacteria bacterium]|nr:DUF4349 domain-containing protein [Candidatus Gottesmanbacteria bacterium]